MEGEDDPLLGFWEGEQAYGGVGTGDHDVDRAVIHALQPSVVELEPVVERARGEHKDGGEAEDQKAEDSDWGREGADHENNRADREDGSPDEVRDGVEGFANLSHVGE